MSSEKPNISEEPSPPHGITTQKSVLYSPMSELQQFTITIHEPSGNKLTQTAK